VTMKKPAIIVDSSCDMPEKLIKKYQIEVLPFRLLFDDQEYLAGEEISLEEVYQKMKEGNYPTTAQVSPKIFLESFSKLAKEKIPFIYLAFSAEMSATYRTALLSYQQLAKEHPDFTGKIIDSRSGSTAIGLMALKAAQLREKGEDLTSIASTIELMTSHIEHIFSLDNLTALQKGGRLSRGKAFVGNILNIKPILQVKEGQITLLEKVRGAKNVLPKIKELMAERGENLSDQLIGISHADDPQRAQQLKEMIEKNFGCQDFMIKKINSVLGAHLGIGGIGVFFLNKFPLD